MLFKLLNDKYYGVMNGIIRVFLLVNFLFFIFSVGFAQQKKPLDHSVYDDWKQVENQQVSRDGRFVLYEINPQIGDGKLFFEQLDDKIKDSIARGSQAQFSAKSNFIVYRIVQPFDTVRSAKLKKVKKDKMPQDSVGVTLLSSNKTWRFPGLKQFILPEKDSDWVAILLERPAATKHIDSVSADTLTKKKPRKKTKDKGKKETGDLLVLFNPVTGDSVAFDSIHYFYLSEKGAACAMVKHFGDSIDSLRVSVYQTKSKTEQLLFAKAGFSSGVTTDQDGKQVAFTFSSDTSKVKNYELCFTNLKRGRPFPISGDSLSRLNSGWAVSENVVPWFHESGKELYFGTVPIQPLPAKDTLTDDEKVSLDIWSWHDDRLQPQQLKQLEKDKKKYYTAVYFPEKDVLCQLADESMPDLRIDKKSKDKYSLGYSNLPYLHNSSWDGGNNRDVYLVNRETGERKEIIHQANSFVSLSPDQRYVLWYQQLDSSWNAYLVKDKKNVTLTSTLEIPFYNELNDVPQAANPYGMAGWTNKGKAIIYDGYDLWSLDPTGKQQPVNVTQGHGRKNHLRYRVVRLDRDQPELTETLLLSAFNIENKEAGFSTVRLDQDQMPVKLVMEPFHFSSVTKAKDADVLIWRKESFEHFPDLYTSQLDFESARQLTDANPQQKEYAWGSVDLVDWQIFDGDTLQGLLYKPADFDPKKKYPMLVYFYERYSDDIHRYYTPKPIRSVINFSYYTSNGYLIFIPDIKYETGYPGQSAFNCIISGTQAMLDRYSFIDRSKLGIQGQSWGGYQTAYLITKTNMFAAAMAGAPVSNMTSAYGGIRWGSGISRAFQYERTQSRIGVSLWDDLPLYLANSPIFFADQVETPLLIMHNDNDGAVPWYQGIELFNALRRLNKPVWMLVYNGAPHNLKRRADCEDLTVRMQQFFDHYLKSAPEPVWMKSGIPALQKGKTFGFDVE